MTVHLQDIIDAMESYNEESDQAYYDTVNNTVEWPENAVWDDGLSEEELEDDRYIALPSKYEIHDYDIMREFVNSQDDEEVYQWLNNAIHGRGAFRMFRAACERFGLLQKWYDFRDKKHAEIAMMWCEDNGLVYDLKSSFVADDEDKLDEEAFLHGDFEKKTPVQKTIAAESGVRLVRITSSNYMRIILLASSFSRENEEEAQERIESYLDHDDEIYAASESGRFIGYSVMQGDTLCELFVVKDRRKKGVGRTLLMQAMQDRDGCVRIAPDNQAGKKFLEKCGFGTLAYYTMKRSS